jgi:exosome complex component RRP4
LTLPCGVDLILGLNGYIWVSKHVKDQDQEGEEGFDAEAVYSNVNDVRTDRPAGLDRIRLILR